MTTKNYPTRGEGEDPNRFADPADILADPSLSDEEKLEALKRLENRISRGNDHGAAATDEFGQPITDAYDLLARSRRI